MLETKKVNLLDVVELVEDLPEYGVKRGEQGVVVEVLDEPEEAYILEFVDESGTSPRLAYWVKPNQIKTSEEIAKEMFERGIEYVNSGDHLNAEREFRNAINLKPNYIHVLHNSIVRSFVGSDEWQKAITAMHMVFRLDPEYEFARRNLAIAYQKYGIQKETDGDPEGALELFQIALSVGPPIDIISDIKNSFSAVFTSLGIREYENGRLGNALNLMQKANVVNPNEITRHNLGIAYAYLVQSSLNEGNYHGAILAFDRAEHAGIASAELLNDYGVAHASAGHRDEAIFALQRALRLSPDNEIIQHNLNLVEGGADAGFTIVEIKTEFYPAPLMQQQEYSIAV